MQIHVTDRECFEPVIVGVAAVKVCRELYTEKFLWKEPPYEYVFERKPFDVIAGTDGLRKAIELGETTEAIRASWEAGLENFRRERAKYLLY